jgi:hypothetical protein
MMQFFKKSSWGVFLLTMLLGFTACESDGKKEVNEPNMITKIEKEQLTLASGEVIRFPLKQDGKSVFFILPPGQFDEGTLGPDMRLNENGVALANTMQGLFKDLRIDGGVLAAMSAVTNGTGQIISEPHGLTAFNFNNIDYGAFLDYVYGDKKGERFVVVEDPLKIDDLLFTISGGTYTMERSPDFGERTIWYVESPMRTKATIRELKY